MKPLKAVKEFSLNNVIYSEGETVEVKNINDIVKLNEKGFIEPLTAKDLQNIEKELKSKSIKINKEEE